MSNEKTDNQKMTPSVEQQRVLDTKDKNIIVSASAGSGKTTVMTAKIKEFIKAGNSVKDLLVLTYTKAAATEMKQKLEKKLLEEDSEFMQKQVDDLSVSDISTFHSFCQKLIKQNFYSLGINPNFEILEELEVKKLLDKSFNDAMKKVAKSKEEDYLFVLETFFQGRNDNVLRDIVFSLKDYFDNVLDDDLKSKTFNFLNSDFAVNFLNENIKDTCSYYIKRFEAFREKSKEYGYDKYVVFINNLLSSIAGLIKGDLFSKLNIIQNLSYETLRKVKEDELDFNNKIRDVLNSFKKYIKKIKDKEYGDKANIEKMSNISKRVLETLFDLHDELILSYNNRKLKLNKFDYSDLEKLTLKLLNDKTINKQIKERYKLICVDEFQDANEIQERIITLLEKENNRFMVGDVKQSIYAFRQSNPDIFLNIQENYKTANNSVALKLNDNYRSNKKILEFVNIVFSKIMTKETSSIDYQGEAKFNGVANYLDDEFKEVSIDIIYNPSKTKDVLEGVYSVKDSSNDDEEDGYIEKEAMLVANKIATLIGKKIYDKDKKIYREIKFEDICILLRSRGNYQKIFSKTLALAGIPLSINSNSLLFETLEGQNCLNFLNIISNFNDDINLASSMLSIFFDFSEQDLADIRMENEKGYFYDAVLNYNKNDELKLKIDNFLNLIKEFKTDLEFFGLYNAFYNFLNKVSIVEKCSLYPDGDGKILNYKTFLQLLTTDMTIDEFLSFNLSPNVVNLCMENSVVNITTIHSSKGLEYPIVFVCNLGADFSREPHNNPIEFNKDYGFACKIADVENKTSLNSIYFDTLKSINKSKDFAEKLRLLYVALTRAKNHLYLIGSKDKLDFKEFNNVLEIKNSNKYLDLIINSLSQNLIDELLENNVLNQECFDISIHNEDLKEIDKDNKIFNPILIQNNYVNKLYDYINIEKEQNNIAFKNSVSSLNKEEYTNITLAVKNLTIDEHLKGYKTNEIGTSVHKILELIDFNKVNDIDYLKNFVDSLIEKKEIIDFNYDINKLFNNIQALKNIAKGEVLKEKSFVMKVPYSAVNNSNINDKILIQGAIDLLIIGEKNIIIDYKLTSILDDNILYSKYKKQLNLYKMAVENAFKIKVDEVYLFNLNKNKFILL